MDLAKVPPHLSDFFFYLSFVSSSTIQRSQDACIPQHSPACFSPLPGGRQFCGAPFSQIAGQGPCACLHGQYPARNAGSAIQSDCSCAGDHAGFCFRNTTPARSSLLARLEKVQIRLRWRVGRLVEFSGLAVSSGTIVGSLPSASQAGRGRGSATLTGRRCIEPDDHPCLRKPNGCSILGLPQTPREYGSFVSAISPRTALPSLTKEARSLPAADSHPDCQ